MKVRLASFFVALSALFAACSSGSQTQATAEQPAEEKQQELRIVSLAGTTTEAIAALGLAQSLVGVDVTSIYPPEITDQLPKVGHVRNLSAEGILALNPTHIIGIEGQVAGQTVSQLESTGIPVYMLELEFSPEGPQRLLTQLGELTGHQAEAEKAVAQLKADFEAAPALETQPRVLFVYARGAGTLLVAGSNTPMHGMIEMAGAENVTAKMEGYKPLTAEAVVSANPDVLLMFDEGIASLRGTEGLAAIPGFAETNAGRNNAVVAMNGALLGAFGPRTGLALAELRQKLDAAMQQEAAANS